MSSTAHEGRPALPAHRQDRAAPRCGVQASRSPRTPVSAWAGRQHRAADRALPAPPHFIVHNTMAPARRRSIQSQRGGAKMLLLGTVAVVEASARCLRSQPGDCPKSPHLPDFVSALLNAHSARALTFTEEAAQGARQAPSGEGALGCHVREECQRQWLGFCPLTSCASTEETDGQQRKEEGPSLGSRLVLKSRSREVCGQG